MGCPRQYVLFYRSEMRLSGSLRLAIRRLAAPLLRALALLVVASQVQAGEGGEGPEEPASRVLPDGRHRLDLGVTVRDAVEGLALVSTPAYSMAVSPELVLRAGSSLVYLQADPDLPASILDEPTSSGFGDSMIQAQYSPAGHLTASPWIPDTIGLTTTLVIPTGDAQEGLSADIWALDMGLGWSFRATRNLWLIPAGYYLESLHEGSLGKPARELGFSLEMRWVFPDGTWFGYRPSLVRDLEIYEWADDHALVVGKIFSNGYGAGLEYGRADRLTDTALRDDYVVILKLFYQYGRAP